MLLKHPFKVKFNGREVGITDIELSKSFVECHVSEAYYRDREELLTEQELEELIELDEVGEYIEVLRQEYVFSGDWL